MENWRPIDMSPTAGRKVKGELIYRLPFSAPLTQHFDQAVDCIDCLAIDVSSDRGGSTQFVCRSVEFSPYGEILVFRHEEPGPESLVFNVREDHSDIGQNA